MSLLFIYLFAYLVTGQIAAPDPFVKMPKPPSLPQITEDLLPGEGWVPGTYKIGGPAAIFDTWKPGRHQIAILKAGTPVTLLTGLCVVSKPDVITVTLPVPEMGLKPGDRLLRYLYRGEGNADFWAKGRWYRDADGGFITELDGSGCLSHCKARVIEDGQRKWWFRIRLTDNRLVWTDADDSLNPNSLSNARDIGGHA